MSRHVWILLVAALGCTIGANWPNWRGPTLNGVAPEGQYPTKWTATENIAWKISLPGRGASTPVVWNKQIFLTYGKDGKNILACVTWDGKTAWETGVRSERTGKKDKASGSNPSAITDGKHVYAYFKSGDLICVDMNGHEQWHHNLQKDFGDDTLWWDLGTSPVLTKNCVVVAVMQTGPSYLVAYDRDSGKQIWKQDRQLNAPVEAAHSYSTPIVVADRDGKETIYLCGADHITAHDATTGAELWRVGGLNPTGDKNFRSIASPVLMGDILIAPYARGKSITAVRLGGKGDVTKSHIAWFKNNLGADVPTPAAQDGRVYFCSDRGLITCLDAKTGNEIWQGQIERGGAPFSSSPIIAGGHIYVTREDGTTFVLKAGDKYELVSTNELPGPFFVATPVFVDGRILIRGRDELFCIGK